jgi:hypothetical protein
VKPSKRSILLTLTAAAVFFTLLSDALAGSGGSAYSLIGLGDIRVFAGGRGAGMGDAGVALASPYAINFLSPAAWSRIDRTRLEGGALYEGFNSSDGATSRYLARMDFNGALMAIPVSSANGITVVLGFVPYTNVNYNTYTHGTQITPTDTVSFALNEIGTGGITKGLLGMSWSPTRSLSVGATVNYLFGTITTQAIETMTGAYGGTIQTERSLSGVNFTGGVLVTDLGDEGSALRSLSMGAVFSTRATVNSTLRTNYQFVSETDTTEEANGRAAIPYSAIIGVGYRWSDRWVLAADYAFQPWSTADLDFIGASANIRNSTRMSAGIERTANRNLQAAWIDRVAYRAGVSYAQSYVTVNGQAIDELTFTAGLTLPVNGDSRLHVAASYGTRGTTTVGLIRDKIFRLSVALSISDLWYVHFGEE